MSNYTQTLPIGTILDSGRRKYTIKKVLGAGSFGITYLATSMVSEGNITFMVSFAIKEHFMASCYRANDGTTVLCTPSAQTEVAMSRADFQTEADRLQKICQKSHNIVNVNETFEANGTAYYVMEYLDGGNPTMTTEAEAIKIVRQIASALDILHQAHVLHLDVKPDNIVMQTDSDGNTYPVLIDFGVSKHFSSSGKPTSHLTAKGASEGYAPQEQYADIETFSPKYDVYAIGAVLLYLVSGKHAPNAFKVSQNQQELKALIPPSVSARTRKAILAAMAPSAFERTPDMKHFIADLSDDTVSRRKGGDTVILGSDRDLDNKSKTLVTVAAIVVAVLGCCWAFFGSVILKPTSMSPSEFEVNGVKFKMLPVEGATFEMEATGKLASGAIDGLKPVHTVTVSDYMIGETEVTQGLWKAVMGSNPSYFKGDDLPVESVSWDDCQKFIKQLNQLTGEKFRLPTEAEWEYAAKGGNNAHGYLYSGSDNIDTVAWWNGNSGQKTHPVGTKQPNELGLYDMSGNVWEWCSNWKVNYPSTSQTNTNGTSLRTSRVYRGCSWYDSAEYCRVSCRNYGAHGSRSNALGLRLALPVGSAIP